MKDLTVVMYGVDNPVVTRIAMEQLCSNTNHESSHIVLVDNGSDVPFEPWGADQLIRYSENIGGNAVHHRLLQEKRFEPTRYIVFLHCDFVVRKFEWDRVLVDAMRDCYLSMAGLVGSNEIDELGGRGGGTALSYVGAVYEGVGQASKAEQHGRRLTPGEVLPAAVLDHCAMAWQTDVLLSLTPQEGNLCPEHFCDRYWSCEVLEKGGRIAVIGIPSDHFGGGIGAQGNLKADALRKKWLDAEGIPYDPNRSDIAVYRESERRFLTRFRDTGFIPLRVRPDWTVEHQHALRGGFWRPRT